MRSVWAFVVVFATMQPALAQDYPARNVSFIVATGAGAATDLLARILATRLGDRLGKAFVVENRPGAGTVLGADAVAKANPDGHTILMGTSTPLAINASLHKKLPYDPAKDFMPLALIATVPFVLVVNNDLPARSVPEFIALAKSKPGEFSYGSTGPGSPFHLYAELFSSMTGIQMVHIPYKAAVAAQVDLMGGRLQVMMTDFTSSLQLIREGKIRALGVTTKNRADAAPEIAPIAELGVPGFEASAWQMVVAPAATPKPVVDKLHAELKAIMAMPETRQAITRIGLVPVDTGSPEELQALHPIGDRPLGRCRQAIRRVGGVGRSCAPGFRTSSINRSTPSMRHIDSFCHFFPQSIFKLMSQTAGGTTDVGKRMQGVRTIYDLDARFRMMDPFDDYTQILSLGLPPLEGMVGPDKTPEFARAANDGLAELVAKYPDRFAGYVGALPMDNPDAAVKEAERILINGNANGLQLHTNVNGACLDEPRFLPIFEVAAKSGKPILLHPARKPDVPDFPAEKFSKYEIWTIFGWPYETSATMARLIFSGVMTRFPKLKVMAHHLGAMIPFFDERIETGWATLGSRTSGEDYSHVLPSLGKPLLDCFKDFYGDTALCGGRIGLVCGLDFYGVDHVLYASDAPFGPEGGAHYIRSQMAAVASLDIPLADKEKICSGNAVSFFGL